MDEHPRGGLFPMICGDFAEELVECARDGGRADAALQGHLSSCGACRERWEAQVALTSHLQAMRVGASGGRPQAEARRAALMREFAGTQIRPFPPVRRPSRVWWGLAVAAALLAAVGLGREAGYWARRPRVQPAAASPGGHRPDGFVFDVADETSEDAGSLSGDEFIAVPYSPPLATGEMVRVVRTELYPEALASMGIDVNPAWSADIPADVVMGQDGLPRAVRISDSARF